jgi:hypothetical protein
MSLAAGASLQASGFVGPREPGPDGSRATAAGLRRPPRAKLRRARLQARGR